VIPAARAALIAALEDALPPGAALDATRIGDKLIARWERDGWYATPERPPAARQPPRRTTSAARPATGATRAA
jgi:hypothetical protein